MTEEGSSQYDMSAMRPDGRLAQEVGLKRQLMGADLITRGDGWERGVRSVLLQNDIISLEVVIDRGMDIAGARIRQVPIGWRSPTDIVAPWHVENSGFGPHRGFFGGLLKTCGLDHIGGPTKREMPEGMEASGEYPMHGRISGAPAKLESYGIREVGGRLEAFVEGTVTQVAVFGENLQLRRSIAISLGSPKICVSDTVSNLGFRESPVAVIYHVNVGWPVLAPGAELELPPTLLQGEADFATVRGPATDGRSMTWLFASAEEVEGKASASVFRRVDEAQSAGLRLTWNAAALPTMLLWQMNMPGGHYAMAFEPSTIPNPEDAAGAGFPILRPGESRAMGIEIELLWKAAAR